MASLMKSGSLDAGNGGWGNSIITGSWPGSPDSTMQVQYPRIYSN
jgi:hypothetical protein